MELKGKLEYAKLTMSTSFHSPENGSRLEPHGVPHRKAEVSNLYWQDQWTVRIRREIRRDPERHEIANHPAACFSFGAVDLWRQQTSRGWTGLSALVSAVCICTNGEE
jgi:hypothetical protein